jgi:CubicO group peptidase (beta-lactamase class C family)
MLISKSVFSKARMANLAVISRLICIKVISLSYFLLFFQAVSAQTNMNPFDAEVKARQKDLGNNVVVMLWANDTLAYKKEFGDFNSKTQAPIASASKWLTAALVMILVDEGKLTLEDKVSVYIPEFARYGKNYITLRHCLSHMTGVDDEGKFLKKILQRKKFSSLEEEVNSFASREIRANPSQDFWYGNIGPNIAGRVLEIVTKKRFDMLIKQKLFNPLTMRRTSFTTLDASAVNPAGGAMSTPDDYMQFMVMLLNKGMYKGKRILNETSVDELMKIQTSSDKIKFAPEVAQGYNYALGSWVIDEKNGKATTLASPGLFGTWPMIDFCRKYAYLVFVKSLLSEQRADVHKQLKEVIEGELPMKCD